MNEPVVLHPNTPLVLILGLGETGMAAARWCARRGARLRLADTRVEPGGLATLRAALDGVQVEYQLGCGNVFNLALLDGVTQVVLSPGLSPYQAPAQALLAHAAVQGVEIVGEIELMARALAELAVERAYQPRLLAVTGTNGKTTVTALTRQLVAACGLTVRAAGNIGPAALSALMEALDANDLPQVWVLELSSFQLETTASLSVDAAVVLNVTQDHLDWHGGMEAYAAAKARVLAKAQVAIVNRDDPVVVNMVPSLPAVNVRSFGPDIPPLVGDLGLEREEGVVWLAACEPAQFNPPPQPSRRKNDRPMPVRTAGRTVRLMPIDALRLRGTHNALNALAALQLARCLDLGWAPILRALREYGGESHRTEFVRSIAGVDFIDDSKGTNVGATVAALEGLGRPVVLIAGGQGKGQDFSPLASVVARRARAVVLIGVDGSAIACRLRQTGVPCIAVDGMQAAVRQAMEFAQPGDAVLLSPACASLDMFRNYAHRGQVFVTEVLELARDKGEVA
jgi:UDP-N-acetylmuramoylalanine--D-glutamate ligase